jgi:hypothetical protein
MGATLRKNGRRKKLNVLSDRRPDMADPSVRPKRALQRTTSDCTDKGSTNTPAWEGRGEEEADDTRASDSEGDRNMDASTVRVV